MPVLRLFGWGIIQARKAMAFCVQQAHLRRFAAAGQGVSLGSNLQLYAPERIRLGNRVSIGHNVTLRAMTVYPWTDPPQRFTPELTIGDEVFINNGSQLSCANRIHIGARVMIAEYCFLADNQHGYADPDRSIRAQPLAIGELTIGDDSWIGANCCIAGGIRIGRHCVIGANAVVTTDIPDYSVAAGAPARIIKQYDHEDHAWKRP